MRAGFMDFGISDNTLEIYIVKYEFKFKNKLHLCHLSNSVDSGI